MTTVHLLWHVHEDDTHKDDAKFIGVYSSNDAAAAAIDRVKDQPGFCDHLAGFEIDAYAIDKDHWVEGFVRG